MKVILGIGMIAVPLFFVRELRNNPSCYLWAAALAPVARSEAMVLFEHVVAGFGLPGLAWAVSSGFLLRPGKQIAWLDKVENKALALRALATVCVIMYAFGGSGHEMDQLMLQKEKTSFGRAVRGCLPDAFSDTELGQCLRPYAQVQHRQLCADALGVCAFAAFAGLWAWGWERRQRLNAGARVGGRDGDS